MVRKQVSKKWWKEAIVYQIYPRSFQDSNGDGIGDLRGVINRLDYLQSLGITMVWLNPVYQSPNHDGGYDISDYCAIDPAFGNEQDFLELVSGLHQRGIKLIMDFVVNHSSDEHPWFMQSKQSKGNQYRDYYFWWPGSEDRAPNNWPSFFGGGTWTYDNHTREYYLHLFSEKQPDLNWENPSLRNEMKQLMKFWLDKGVDGLRLDVISAISKRIDFPDSDTRDFNETVRRYYANGPRLQEFIAEMRTEVWDKYDIMTVGEGPGIAPDNALDYLDADKGVNMIFHFGHMLLDQGPGGRFDPIPWSMRDFKSVFSIWDDTFSEKGWGSLFLGNHDFARMVSRWGNDMEYHEMSAKLLITLLLTMRGTPFIFQGDEIGMTNLPLRRIADAQDIESKNGWEEAKKQGKSEQEFLVAVNQAGRDNARTPMQWDNAATCGFTSGKPWMPINPNSKFINVAKQERESDSILNYFKAIVSLRKSNHALIYGKFREVNVHNENLFVYEREYEQEKWIVALNFSDDTLTVRVKNRIPEILSLKRVMGNYVDETQQIRPWEAIVYKT